MIFVTNITEIILWEFLSCAGKKDSNGSLMCKLSVIGYCSVVLSLTTVNIHQFLPQSRHLQEASQQEHVFCAGSGRRRAVVSQYPEFCLLRVFSEYAKGWPLILFSSSVFQFGGTDGGHPETADGPGVHAGV